MSGFVSSANPTRLTARRLVTVLGIATLALAALALLAPLLGVTTDGNGRHLDLLSSSAFDSTSTEYAILWVRIPRVLACLLVGAALATSGAGLQAILRNPLAEPFTLGISSGSALAAVIAIRVGVETWLGSAGVGLAALLGAGTTLLVVWRLARTDRQLPAATLVLAGVTVSMFCSAASVLIQYTSDFSEVSRMLRWMMGGLESMRLSTVGWAAAPILVGIATLIGFSRELNALAAGEEAAASVGVAVARTQSIVFIVASLLVGVSIAVAGPIGFVGLIAARDSRHHWTRSSALGASLGPRWCSAVAAVRFAGPHGRSARSITGRCCHRVARWAVFYLHLGRPKMAGWFVGSINEYRRA